MDSEILIYQNMEGDIKIDVRLEDETVWLTQGQLCELFQKSKATISEHIRNVFTEGELDAGATVRKFRTVQSEGKRKVERDTEHLTHAGKISHDMALKKSDAEYEKYRLTQKEQEKEHNLKELEQDIKKLQKPEK